MGIVREGRKQSYVEKVKPTIIFNKKAFTLQIKLETH